jgi:acetyl esterase
MRYCFIVAAIGLLTAANAPAQQEKSRGNRSYPPQMDADRVETYKTVGDVRLNLWIYTPEGHKATDRRPAIVFFFGGGWRSGTPRQFEPHCEYLASRGMVAMAADYRVANRHGVKAKECVADAKSAVRWIRAHAEELGVDPERIAAGGGSAGGHLAASTALVPGFEDSTEDANVSSVPNSLVLFNPAVALAPIDGRSPLNPDRVADLEARMGVAPEKLSPYHHVKPDAPPTIIFHGRNDTTVTYRSVEQFTEKMKQADNRCTLVGYDGQGHGFFNFGRGDNEMHRRTVRAMDEFLAGLGYLEGPPTVE